MNRHHHPSLWGLLGLALLSTPLLGQSPLPQASSPSTAAIAFSRTQWRTYNQIDSIGIYRTDPQGLRTVRLTPQTSGVQYRLGGWSPSGNSIVYELFREDRPGRSQLYAMDREGGSVRQITQGTGTHSMPAWGPGGIAYAEGPCLALVRGDGEGQHKLFCPPEDSLLQPPQWMVDGTNILIRTGHYEGSLEPVLLSSAWRVDSRTGQASLLAHWPPIRISTSASRVQPQAAEPQPDELYFSPTGREALLFRDPEIQPSVYRVDLTTGAFSAYPIDGYSFVYSPDGARVALGGHTTIPGYIDFANVYVAGRLGDNLRQITRNYNNTTISWLPVQWSRNGRRLLAEKLVYTGDPIVHPRHELHILDLDTGAQVRLPDGEGGPGSWFQP